MFWPDARILGEQTWWTAPAWAGGPTLGAVVEALRPALRAALLLGWQVDSIEIGIGKAAGQSTMWTSIELATLELISDKPLDVDRPFGGPNVHLGAFEVADLHGRIGDGTFGIPIDIPVFGGDDLTGAVPAELVDGVTAFVNEAIDELTSTVPTDPVLAAPRAIRQGLLWMLYAHHWHGLNDNAAFEIGAEVAAMRADPTGFLLGELHGQPVTAPSVEFWAELWLSLQARGEANRVPQSARDRLPSMSWLDALSELVWRGAVIVDGLVEADDPPEPIEVTPTDVGLGEPITAITLSIWGGEAEITLRRVLVFDDDGKEDLESSVSWDYVPGNAQQRPTVVIVAGRGVAIEHPPAVVLTGRSPAGQRDPAGAETARVGAEHAHLDQHDNVPVLAWDLLVHRVQDDNLIKPPGALIDPAGLLSLSLVDPDPSFLVAGPPTCLMVAPKHDGVLLQFPGKGTNGPTTTPVSGIDVPRVIELTIDDPCSGTTAWTVDVHFFPYSWARYPLGLAHLCVWVSEGVSVHTNDSPEECGRGDPSKVAKRYPPSDWLYSAELWEVDKPEKLARPFSRVLPLTESTVVLPNLVGGMELLEYDGDRARYDGITLIPAWHCYRQYGYLDSLGLILLDILISAVPFVGDIADIGEAIWAWQRGRDKWGRPVTEFELTLMILFAAVPIVSSGFIRGLAGTLAETVTEVPTAELGRLVVPAQWAADVPLDQMEAVRAIVELTRPVDDWVSLGRREKAELAIRGLAANDTAIRTFAERLAAGRAAGLPNVADTLSQNREGFSVGPLQTAYLRYLRDHPGATDSPLVYVQRMVGGQL